MVSKSDQSIAFEMQTLSMTANQDGHMSKPTALICRQLLPGIVSCSSFPMRRTSKQADASASSNMRTVLRRGIAAIIEAARQELGSLDQEWSSLLARLDRLT